MYAVCNSILHFYNLKQLVIQSSLIPKFYRWGRARITGSEGCTLVTLTTGPLTRGCDTLMIGMGCVFETLLGPVSPPTTPVGRGKCVTGLLGPLLQAIVLLYLENFK